MEFSWEQTQEGRKLDLLILCNRDGSITFQSHADPDTKQEYASLEEARPAMTSLIEQGTGEATS